ncbi:uncharacterized protein LOC144140044 [Haemaphysalis longicornis]
MTGFRHGISTQDAMLLIKRDIYDQPTGDSKAIPGLDLLGAFDNVRHVSILQQILALNMEERTHAYVRAFLSDRTVTLHAGEMQLPSKRLGSVGTPQGAVISPFHFNIVMFKVAAALYTIPEARYNIYTDDITIWTARGSDGHIADTLQRARQAVETSLTDTGLKCSPPKSELLIITPRRPRSTVPPDINLYTADGNNIPKVDRI